jgi:anti-anti-sigma regulatory factor
MTLRAMYFGFGTFTPRSRKPIPPARRKRNRMTYDARLESGVLTVYLPPVLGLHNRQGLIDAIEGETRRFLRLRLDASLVTDIDAAGLGILARAVRLARDKTSQAPILRSPTDCATQLLRSVGLLNSFDIEA